jgi:cyclohexanecarboxylate-CoA ligase
MEFDAVLIGPRKVEMVEKGFWLNQTIGDFFEEALNTVPEKNAIVSFSTSTEKVETFTYKELDTLVKRIAIGLHKLGVRKDDVVSCQLPNCWQLSALYLACSQIGAVLNPLMHIFRERELSFMLKHGESKVIVVPKVFRNFDYEEMLLGLKENLPNLEHVITIGTEGDNSFEKCLLDPAFDNEADKNAILNSNSRQPDDVTQLIYTSGTTGEPKGVMHTANTMFSNVKTYAERLGLNQDSVVLMASPMAHQTGFMYGLMMPIFLKTTAVLQDVWDPAFAARLISEYKCTFTMASTPFLTDLANEVEKNKTDVSSMKTFLCAGAPIPGPLVAKAEEILKIKVISAWGMTENGAVTTTRLDDASERSINTDGCPLPGVEIQVVDGDGTVLGANKEGRLQLRSCSNFGGYLKRPHLNDMSEDYWFETGDMAYIDEAGYVRITGRSKDIIIRGAENIPVVEIESILYGHEKIAMVAVVGYPDERLGERACACIRLKDGVDEITFEEVIDYLASEKVTKQYYPEKLIVLDSFPATPSGKIQKFKLREFVAEEVKRL